MDYLHVKDDIEREVIYMSKLIVEVDEGLHKKIGDRARSESKTIKEIITSLVENFLGDEDQAEEEVFIQSVELEPEPEPNSVEIERQQEKSETNERKGWGIW